MSSYYGRSADNISNVITLDNITFNGGTTYALTQNGVAFVPNNSSSILISIDGVVQQGNFTTNNSNIVFNFSPTSSNTCNWILHIGVGVAYVPAASSITKDKTDFVSTSSSPGLEIKGDGTTDGTLQLSCSQGSHGIKLKSPAHSTSSSYTLTFPGTDPAANKMLQTDGSGNLSFVDAPSGASTLISTTDISDGTSTVQISFTGSYALYYVTFTNVNPNNNDNTFRHAFSDDNFSSVNQQLYGAYYRQEARRDNSTSSSTGHQAATGYVRIADHVGSGQYEGVAGIIYYASMKTSAPKARYWGNMASYHQDERMSNHMLTGFADVTNVITGVAYNYDSGTFKSGQIKLYGFN